MCPVQKGRFSTWLLQVINLQVSSYYLSVFVTCLGFNALNVLAVLQATQKEESCSSRGFKKLLSCVPREAMLERLNTRDAVRSMTDLVLILLLSAPVCVSWLWMKAAEQ